MYVHKKHLLFYCCLFGKSLECSRGFLSLILLIALLNRKRDEHFSPFQTDEMVSIVKVNRLVEGRSDHGSEVILIMCFLLKDDAYLHRFP